MKTFKQTVALLLSVFMVLLTLGAVPVMAEEKSGHTTIADGVNEVTIDGKTFAVIRDKAGLMAKITGEILSENLIFANDIDMGGECFSAAIANLQNRNDLFPERAIQPFYRNNISVRKGLRFPLRLR